jgi:hypothetical protein
MATLPARDAQIEGAMRHRHEHCPSPATVEAT